MFLSSRLTKLESTESSGASLGQLTEETRAKVESVYGITWDDLTDESRTHDILEKVRGTRIGRFAGKTAIAASVGVASWLVPKGLEVPLLTVSGLGVVGRTVFNKKAVSGFVGKVSKGILGSKANKIDFDVKPHILEQVSKIEEESGQEFSAEERATQIRRLETREATEAMKAELEQFVGRNYFSNSEIATNQEIADVFSSIAVSHLGRLFGLGDLDMHKESSKKSQGTRRAVLEGVKTYASTQVGGILSGSGPARPAIDELIGAVPTK